MQTHDFVKNQYPPFSLLVLSSYDKFYHKHKVRRLSPDASNHNPLN